jgi:hypothetical protein
MFNAKIVEKTGSRVRDSIYFSAESSSEITPEQAKEAQARLGYIPAGYGFEGFKVEKDMILLRYKATWKCQASCD